MRQHMLSAMLIGILACGTSGSVEAAPCAAQQGQNLVVNPTFESGLDGWEIVNPVGESAKVELVTEGAREGQHSLHAANSDDRDLRPVGVRQWVAVEGGQHYLLSVQAKNTALKSSGGVRITVFDAAGGKSSDLSLTIWRGGGGGYNRREFQATR